MKDRKIFRKSPLMSYVLISVMFIWLGTLFYGCSKGTSGGKPIRIIPDFGNETSVGLAELADSVTYIPLGNQVRVGTITRLKFAGRRIYIEANNRGIIAFDIKGNYLNLIGKLGEGLREISSINDFTIDPATNEVYILDKVQIKVFSGSGKFIRSMEAPVEEYFPGINFFNNKIYLFDTYSEGKAKYNWIVTDTLAHKLGEKLNPVKPFKANLSFNTNPYFEAQNKLFYWDYLNDTIYSIRRTGYRAAYVFANGPNRLTPGDLWNTNMKPELKAPILTSVTESGRYLILYYLWIGRNQSSICAFDNKSTEFRLINTREGIHKDDGIRNDWDGGVPFLPKTTVKYNSRDYLAGWIYTFQLKAFVARDTFRNYTPVFPEKKQEIEQLADSLDIADNPVIMLVKLKK